MNRDEARKRAAELNIPGRGSMTADQLRKAIADAEDADAMSGLHPEVDPPKEVRPVAGRRSLVDSFTRMMARRAGDEGESPSSLDAGRRVANYERQNGRRFQLTPKQARRVRQKLRRGTSPSDPPAEG